jgi:hypothetical protein
MKQRSTTQNELEHDLQMLEREWAKVHRLFDTLRTGTGPAREALAPLFKGGPYNEALLQQMLFKVRGRKQMVLTELIYSMKEIGQQHDHWIDTVLATEPDNHVLRAGINRLRSEAKGERHLKAATNTAANQSATASKTEEESEQNFEECTKHWNNLMKAHDAFMQGPTNFSFGRAPYHPTRSCRAASGS